MYVARQTRGARNEDIEILRAYAVLLVLYEHIVAVTGIEGIRRYYTGWTGVDLFFCVSGFVIYQSISPSLEHGMAPAGAARQIVVFWIRRFWRLAPAAVLWLALGFPVILVARSAEAGTVVGNLTDAIAALIGVENFQRYACNLLHDPCGLVYSPYWSLSLEAQFYLLLPFALVLLPRRWMTFGLIGVIVVQFPLHRLTNNIDLGWFIRTDAMAWGILIARIWETGLADLMEPRFLRHPIVRFGFTFGLIFLLGTSQIFWRLPFFVGLVAIFSACLVWAASYDNGYVGRALGGGAVLRWIGHRSYTLYVSHVVMIFATRVTLQRLGVSGTTTSGKLLYAAAAVIAMFAASALTYRFVEQPLRRRGRAYAQAYLQRVAMPLP